MSTTAADPGAAVKRAFGDFEHELAGARRVLERVPEEHLAWKPHPKSFSLGELATHVATIPFWGTMTLQTEELDFAQPQPPNPVATSREELLARFDKNAADALAAMEAAEPAAFGQPWTLRVGEKVIFSQPRAGVMRGFVISHLIHHRAQLAVYLRLLDVPVPALYGPSADEPNM